MTTLSEGTPPHTERRAILRLGLPFLIGVLASSLTGTVDTAMMGHYGADSLAAVAAGSVVFDVFITVTVATVAGYQILSARFAGRGDGARIADSLRAVVKLSVVVAVPLIALCFLLGRTLTRLVSSGANPDVVAAGGQYLETVAPTLAFAVAFTALTATFNAFKMVRSPMQGGLLIASANVLLDWLLIYGKGPFPELGAAGNGLATTLAWAIGLTFLVIRSFQTGLWGRLRTAGDVSPPDFEVSVARLSLPAMMSSGLDYMSTAAFFAIVGGLGAAALGGARIAFSVMVLIYGLGSAFSAAVRILIGRSIGGGDTAGARRIWRAGRSMLIVPAVVVGLALILLRDIVALGFTSFPAVRAQIVAALVLIGFVVPLMLWNLSNVAAVRAFGKTKLDMYGNIVAAAVVQLPIAWLFGPALGLGIAGAFVGVAAYWIVRGTLLEVWARHCMRQKVGAPEARPRADTGPETTEGKVLS